MASKRFLSFIQSLSEVPGEAARGRNFPLCRLGLAPCLLGPSERLRKLREELFSIREGALRSSAGGGYFVCLNA